MSKPVAALPGLLLCAALGGLAWWLEGLEKGWLGRPLIEALVLAILLGIAWRNLAGHRAVFKPGIDFCAKPLLEFAVLLLGAGMDLREVLRGGPKLLLAIALAVALTLAFSTWLGRRLGLPGQSATLIAVGNSICGNSAIAAIAPLIGAGAAEVAGAIAFTAVLGVCVVLSLPLAIPLCGLDHYQYGVLAGMTVYAVPQVLAASYPVSALSGETGTLVKLVRVMLLGPVALWYTLTRRTAGSGRPKLSQLVPWFIAGFAVLLALRSAGVISPALGDRVKSASKLLTIGAMAALGLGCDLRALRAAGLRTAAAVTGSLLFLIAFSLLLIKTLRIGA